MRKANCEKPSKSKVIGKSVGNRAIDRRFGNDACESTERERRRRFKKQEVQSKKAPESDPQKSNVLKKAKNAKQKMTMMKKRRKAVVVDTRLKNKNQ